MRISASITMLLLTFGLSINVSASSERIKNGDFDDAISMNGWDWASIDLVAGWGLSGTKAVDMNGTVDAGLDGSGEISQTFHTVPGAEYDVSFWLSANAAHHTTLGCTDSTKTLTTTVDGVTREDSVTTSGTVNPPFVPITFSFTASSGSATLTFSGDASEASCGPVIDSASVVGPVPAPTRTGWEQHDGLEVTATNPLGWIEFSCTPSKHGDICEYDVATIPDAEDAGWFGAPDPDIVDFSIRSRLCRDNHANPAPSACWDYGDFTYFQTFVTIPTGTVLTEFTIEFEGMDDGSRISICNSENPSCSVVTGSYVFLGGSGTTDLKDLVVVGETNRVVITQVDDCCSGNNLRVARVNLNGTVVEPPPPPDTDGDGVIDVDDNCPLDANTDQTDTDGDGTGDACDSTPNGEVFIDVYDASDLSAPIETFQAIRTAETGQAHYDFFSASGHPTCVDLGPKTSNIWVHQDTGNTNEDDNLTFGFIFGKDNDAPRNSPAINFAIRNDGGLPTRVAQSDDPGEAVETTSGSAIYQGNFNYRINTDGIAVDRLGGGAWTIAIDSVDFGVVDTWQIADGTNCPTANSLPLTIGNTYCLTPAGNTPDCTEIEIDQDDDGINDSADNCPLDPNTDQADNDADGLGNVCDNCPDTANIDQADTDGDGTGDACENEPPVALCTDQITSAGATCTGSASIDNGSFDPEGDVVSLSQDPAGPYDHGDTVVILTVSDGELSDSCSATVSVEDFEDPDVQCPDPVEECSSPDGATSVFTASVTDNCSATASCDQSGDIFQLGSTPITCDAVDIDGNSASCTGEVTVVDTTAPSITCPDVEPVQCNSPEGAIATFAASATDTCDIEPGVVCPDTGTPFPVGDTTTACTATDADGNTATCDTTVTVIDTIDPVITCPVVAPTECTSPDGAAVSFAASATDSCDINGDDVTCAASGDTFAIGSTTTSCSATDVAGNETTCNTTVTVIDIGAPSVFCNVPDGLNLAGSDLPASFTATGDDVCSAVDVSVAFAGCTRDGSPTGCSASASGATLTISELGNNKTAHWTATAVDSFGNSTTVDCSASRSGGGGSQGNQGVGNGPEGSDPGNSNQGDPANSNDENGGTPGNPGKKGGKKK